MIGINYGQGFPWDRIEKDETVFMVDFTLQPFDQMERLDDLASLVWIDHHKTEVEEANKRGFSCDGIRKIGTGACELTWKYFEYENPMCPLAILFLAQYDVWDHSDPAVLPFQYGFRMFPDTRPDNQELWEPFFMGNGPLGDEWHIVRERGELLLEYEEQQNAKFCMAYAFPTVLYFSEPNNPDRILHDAICANRGFTNSKVFDSVYDPTKHDMMITFCRLKPPAHKWTVSLYSTKPEIDCGQIARTFGGGGHKGAAGFSCKELPFEY